jgi:hypothetical protein
MMNSAYRPTVVRTTVNKIAQLVFIYDGAQYRTYPSPGGGGRILFLKSEEEDKRSEKRQSAM